MQWNVSSSHESCPLSASVSNVGKSDVFFCLVPVGTMNGHTEKLHSLQSTGILKYLANK